MLSFSFIIDPADPSATSGGALGILAAHSVAHDYATFASLPRRGGCSGSVVFLFFVDALLNHPPSLAGAVAMVFGARFSWFLAAKPRCHKVRSLAQTLKHASILIYRVIATIRGTHTPQVYIV